MKYTFSAQAKPKAETKVGHDDDQHVTILMGEDLTALTDVDDLEDGQPSASTESLEATVPTPVKGDGPCSGQCQEQQYPPCVTRVIDTEGNARISIFLGNLERTKWLAHVIGLIDSASEKDTIHLTLVDSGFGDSVYNCRSLLSAISRCHATVITHAGFLTSLGDVALWLSGDQLRWSKKMTAIFVRQLTYGYGGDIRDLVSKGRDAETSFKEFSDYIAKRGLFTKAELNQMYETRGMLSLSGQTLEARMANLKQVTEE